MRYSFEGEPIPATLIDAAQLEPVFIDRGEEQLAVLMSVTEYERLRGVLNQEFQDLCDEISARAEARGMTEEKLEEILRDA